MSFRAVASFLSALWLAGAAHAAAPAAEVVALEGKASANASALAVGDPIAAGSVIRTGSDGKVGILASDIYVQLDPQSAVLLEDDAGRVKMTLQEGRARIVDTRKNAPAGSLSIDRARSAVAGGDSEVYVLNEKAGRYAMFCNWTGPVQVTRDPSSLSVDPGHCVLSKPHEALYGAQGHEHQIPLLPLPFDAVLFDAPANHFDTTDVAAGPPGFGFGDPMTPLDRTRDPCDTPGSGCKKGKGLTVVEPPPDGGGCAPGVVCGPPVPAPPPVVTPPPLTPPPVETGGPGPGAPGCGGPGARRH
ncbi:MAG TPA: hypothetical protein VMR86_03805 [Myxococcota bacterium]|nr:hypothetical protein [Myxococcota bacterium]